MAQAKHTAFFTWKASIAKLMNDHVTHVFSLGFFLERSVRSTSWRKTPKLTLTSCFSVRAQTSLKWYSERVLFQLSSSLSRINDVFVNMGKKQQLAHCTWTQRRLSSSHLSLRSRSYRQWSFARTSSPQTLSICRLCFGSPILGACACMHSFSSLLSKPGSHRDQWKACVAAWRFVHCLAIVEGGKTTAARGSSSSPPRHRKAPKCVRREYICSVSLRFPCFWAWQNRNCQSECCLDCRHFFCNRKLVLSFSEADRMELDATSSSARS